MNWGIGRELYTAPDIYIPANKCKIVPKGNKYTTYDKFYVERIKYNANDEIVGLSIKNQKNVRVFVKMPPKEEFNENNK